MTKADPTPDRRHRGFERAGSLVAHRVRAAGETRGFAVARVLTHWDEIVGPETAARARPVKVSYPPAGLGATLTVLTTGAWAPVVEMQKEAIRARVNAAYGYNAVSRIVLTQTAPTGFGEGQRPFGAPPPEPAPDPAILAEAGAAAGSVNDPELRAALEGLARNVLSRSKSKEEDR